MADHGYKVGQEVIYVPPDLRSRDEVWTIEKIGLRWAHCGRYRSFCLKTGVIKPTGGYSPSGRVWRCRRELCEHRERRESWKKVRELTISAYKAPEHLGIEDINDIINKLEGDH